MPTQTLHFYKISKSPESQIELINNNSMNYLMENKMMKDTVVDSFVADKKMYPYCTEVNSSFLDYDGDKIIKDFLGLNEDEYHGYNIYENKSKNRVILHFTDSNFNHRIKKFKKEYVKDYLFQRKFTGMAFEHKEIYNQTKPESIRKIVDIIDKLYPIDYYDDFHIIDGNTVKQAIIEAEGYLPTYLLKEDFNDIALEIKTKSHKAKGSGR